MALGVGKMNPDYAAEIEVARDIAISALEGVDHMAVAEMLPEELYSEEATERVLHLVYNFDLVLSALAETVYLHSGKIR